MRKIAVGLAIGLALAACVPPAYARHAPEARSGSEHWTVSVSVEPTDVGPIAVSVGPARAVPENEARVWIEHDLVLENRGDRPVTFADTELSTFLGRRALIAADEGCGYAYEGRAPVEAGVCRLSLDAFVVEPHSEVRRTIALFQGLRGMEPLTSGTYVFEKPIRFQVGREIPEAGAGRAVVIRLVYEIA
jgi:hypothetical protein